MRTTKQLVAVAAVLLVAAACHKTAKGPTTLSPNIAVQITNNLVPPNSITAYVTGSNGGRQLLGSVGPSRTETFNYQPVSATDQFRLIGQLSTGRSITSQQFSLVNLVGVNWDLNTNSVTFSTP